MKSKNILFVDIDGCLTSVDTGTYFATDPKKYKPSKKIVCKLKQFCKDNDAKVVISSNWRKFETNGIWKNSYGEFKNPLPSVISMLDSFYAGTLPIARHARKSEALILWFEENNFDGNFAIFDDDLNERYQTTFDYGIKDHFILCDAQYGITDENLKDALDILNV